MRTHEAVPVIAQTCTVARRGGHNSPLDGRGGRNRQPPIPVGLPAGSRPTRFEPLLPSPPRPAPLRRACGPRWASHPLQVLALWGACCDWANPIHPRLPPVCVWVCSDAVLLLPRRACTCPRPACCGVWSHMQLQAALPSAHTHGQSGRPRSDRRSDRHRVCRRVLAVESRLRKRVR